jgi:hypothetical protein
MAYLCIRPPHGRSTRAALGASAILGRTLDADIWVADQRLSRLHCRVERDGEHWVVTDLGSRNGTFVNRTKVERHVLNDGDEFEIGDTRVTFFDRPLTERPKDPMAAGLVDSGRGRAVTAGPVDPGESLSGTRFASHATPRSARRSHEGDLTITGHLPPTAFRRPHATPQVGPAPVDPVTRDGRRVPLSTMVVAGFIGAAVVGACLYFLL